ncbi:PAS domain S-box protein [Pedobacter sp. UYP1]|uniref:PAS domain-containing protein n=1 Tax=Pedobacter sp. UYP1 TaxID=1756396 RepID=UPI003398164D
MRNDLNSKLLIENSFQHLLFNDYPDPVFTLDLEGNFLSANKALIDLAGCTKEELFNLTFAPFIVPDDLEITLCYFQKAIMGEIQNFDTHIISTKGTPGNFNITNLPIVINNEVIGVHVIAKDITTHLENKKQLEVSNNRISSILESITDCFFALNKDWTVTYWNKEVEHLLKMPRKDIIGKNLWEVYQNTIPLKFYSEYHRAVADRVSVRFDEYFPSFNIWIEVSAFPSEEGLSVYFKDITERKKSEQQLKLEKEKYRDLFNFSPIPQWVYDLENLRFLDVNNAAVKHYLYTKEEFLQMTIRDIRPTEDVSSLEAVVDHDIKPGIFHQSMVRHLKKNGTVMDVCVEGNSILFDGKNARLVLAIDYTEKITSERALAASERRFKALVQDGSDLIAILDLAGNYQYVSPTSKSILGTDADYYIGKNAFDFIHIDDQENVRQHFNLLKEQKQIKIPPYRFKIENKNYHWIETIVTNMMDDPTVAGIVANSRDVTQRIESEIKTEESIERFNILSKATNEAIWDWDIRTGSMIWNRGIKGIFGYNQNSYNRDWWHNRVHPEDVRRIVVKIQSLIKCKKSRLKVEYRFRSANGDYKYVLDRSFLMFDKTGAPLKMIGSMQDITDSVHYIEAIEKQNQQLREIAFTQSHHVRAPLARIIGLSKLLTDSDEREEIKKEYLQYLVSSAEELDVVIKDIVKKTEII